MSSEGTKKRPIRMPDELWEAAQVKAAALGVSVSEVIREMLTEWVDQPY